MSAFRSGEGVEPDCFWERLRWRKEEACGVLWASPPSLPKIGCPVLEATAPLSSELLPPLPPIIHATA